MQIKKTLSALTLVLALLLPSVSHAADVSANIQSWFGSFSAQVSSVGDQLASALLIFGDPKKVDLRLNGSNGPVRAQDGLTVSARWFPGDILSYRQFQACTISYPGDSGRITKSVSSFGSLRFAIYPSRSTPSSVDLTCTRQGAPVSDSVSITLTDTQATAATRATITGSASVSGASGAGVSGHSAGSVSGGIAPAAGYGPGGSVPGYQYVPIGNTGGGAYVPIPGTTNSPEDIQTQEFIKTQAH